MAIVIELDDDRIADAKFRTYGCPVARACGEYVCQWSLGRRLEELALLDEAAVVAGVGHPPLGREHCPGLAVKAIHIVLQGERLVGLEAT